MEVGPRASSIRLWALWRQELGLSPPFISSAGHRMGETRSNMVKFKCVTLRKKVKVLVVSNSLWPHGLQPAMDCRQAPLSMEFSKSTGMSSHFLLQGIFPTQGSNLGFPHWRQILYLLSHQGSQTQKATCCLTPLIWHSEKDRTIRDRNRYTARGWGCERSWLQRGMWKFLNVMEWFYVLW